MSSARNMEATGLARDLIRSITRAFYPPEQVIIIDAILQHSALRDDDLALLMGQNTKTLRKTVSKLKDDGLVASQTKAETKPNQTRPTAREYYFIDVHRAIDVIKFRLKKMSREVEARYSKTEDERKEYRCPRCKTEYTQMDVLDSVGAASFVCKRCKTPLDTVQDEFGAAEGHAGHEVQSKLNNQLSPFEGLMRRIDNTDIPENDFETAIANAVPVKRDYDPAGGQAQLVQSSLRMPAATVHGAKMEQEKIQISLLDEDSQAAEAVAEKERKAKLAEQNALPEWHTSSTVTGEKVGPHATKASDDLAVVKPEEDEDKKDVKPAVNGNSKAGVDQAADIASFFDYLNEEGDENEDSDEEADEDDDDGDDDEDDDDDDGEAEAGRPTKRVRVDEAASTPGDSTPAAATDTPNDSEHE